MLNIFLDLFNFATGPTYATEAMIAFIIGPLPILVHLLWTGSATFESVMVCIFGCNDDRFLNVVEILGGAAGFSIGLIEYWLATHWLSNMGLITDYVFGTAKMSLWLSIFQVGSFFIQIVLKRGKILATMKQQNAKVIWISAHFLGCGWVTATGLFWWLYWLQWIAKKIGFSGMLIRLIRDFETPFKWLASLPIIFLLNILTLLILQRFMLPGFEWKPTNAKAHTH